MLDDVLSLDFSVPNSILFLWIPLIFISWYIHRHVLRAPVWISPVHQDFHKSLWDFVAGSIKQQAGARGLIYLPVFFTTFVVILLSNVIGLIPFAFTPTSHIAITFSMALTFNLAFIFFGFRTNGARFLLVLVPRGSPLWLLPLIVMIEFISYLLRTFSLSIRLFANMMAGHTLIHILASFATSFWYAGWSMLIVFPLVLTLAVFFLELGIAFLQAYVFVVLLSIYLNDSLNPRH